MPPYNTIVVTPFTLPTVVFDNGQVTGNPWNNPSNLFLVDTEYSQSNVNQGVASDVTVGGYNFEYNGISIPQGAVITGIELQVIGHRGAQTVPPITLDISLYDNVDGVDDFYPYTTGFTGLTTTDTTTVLGTPNYLFNSSFTVDQINNLKMNLKGNGDISLDSFLVRVYFYIPAPTPAPTPSPSVCIDCESPIQVQEMFLAIPFLSGETKFYLKKGSLTYPNGIPVQPGDVGSCGGKLFFVFDEGKKKDDGNFEENVTLDTNTGSWSVLPSGIVEVDINSVNNRGLDYKQPATHVATNMSNHDANSKVIISNNTPYNLTLVRTCQADLIFSPPIDVEKDGADIVNPIHTLNFIGGGVSVAQNGTDPYQADITIAGGGTGTPTLDNTSSATGGNVQVPTLSWTHTSNGTNRLLTIQVSMEQGKTVTGITYNGIAMTFSHAQAGGGTRMEMWYLVAPSVGTHTIIVTFSADSYCSAGAESWSGIDQSSPIGATGSATGASLTPSLVLNTTTDNSIVVDGLSTDLTPILLTAGAGQIENWHRYANTDTRQGASSYEAAGSAPDAVTMSWAITQNTDWSLCAMEIKGIAALIATLEVLDEGVVVDSNVSKMDFTGAAVTVVQTAPGEVEVQVTGGGGGSLDVEEDGVTVETAVTVMNFTGTGVSVTNPAPGQVDVDISGGGGSGGNPGSTGTTTRGGATASGNQVIPHGLGITPTKVRLVVRGGDDTTNAAGALSDGVYIPSIPTTNCVFFTMDGGADSDSGVDSTNAVAMWSAGQQNDGQLATVTVDSTNITIAWTKVAGGYDDGGGKIMKIMWEATVDGGGSGERKVGVGESNDINWLNFQPLFIDDGTARTWNLGNAGAGDSFSHIGDINHETFGVLVKVFPDFDSMGAVAAMRYVDGRQMIIQGNVTVNSGGSNAVGWGFGNQNLFGASSVGIQFVTDGAPGNWYVHASNGVSFTDTAISNLSDGVHTLRIESDLGNGTPQARFYVDGLLVQTITTTLPTASTAYVDAFVGNSTVGSTNPTIPVIGAPSFAVEV